MASNLQRRDSIQPRRKARISYRMALNEALAQEMRRDPKIIILGEDIAGGMGAPGQQDTWGGAFGVTKGLLGEFGRERVLDTPLQESAIIGAAIGAASNGLRPVAELMFNNFLGVCMDQLMNQVPKFRYMFGGKLKTPVTIRTVYGAGIRVAAQHSSAYHALLTHIPGLKVVMPSSPYDAKGLLISSIRDDDPVIFFEHICLFDKEGDVPEEQYSIPFGEANVVREGDDATIVAFGRMVDFSVAAAELLQKEGISCTVIDPRTTSPLDEDTILDSVGATGRLIVVDEGNPRCGIATDIAGLVAKKAFDALKAPIEMVTAPHCHVPFAPVLEDAYLPNADKIAAAVRATRVIAVADKVHGLVMPKYGMVMTEGRVSGWRVEEGTAVSKGDELLDIETEKVANVYESPANGILRRKLAPDGQAVPIGGLFGVIAAPETDEAQIDAFVQEFQANFSAADAAAQAPTPEVIDIEQGYIRALQAGDASGSTIVLIHGFGGDLSSWILNQNTLADGHAVYAVDLPGHGGSVKSPDIASVAKLAAAIGSFLESKALSTVHLVGHSLGGAVAAQIAIDRPRVVASLTLLAPVGLGKEINGAFITGMIEVQRRKEMQAVMTKLFYDPKSVSSEMVANVLKARRIDGALDCLRAVAAACFPQGSQAFSLRDQLGSLGLPIQVIWGANDEVIPAEHAEHLPQNIKTHTFGRAGHMIHMERPAEVNGLIRQLAALG